ncbi:MAG TPA: hypothetical protein VHZ50_16320 [Puia sp.]|nr:hypothetical protein [Puia sp.]
MQKILKIPELMKTIGIYGSWKITTEFRLNKFSQMEIKCNCENCKKEKWFVKYQLLEERKCQNCRSINRTRNNYRRKSNRLNPIGNFREKDRIRNIEKYD